MNVVTTNLNAKPCIICDSPAHTKEHIVPQWLQKHFGLANQKLEVWNGTSLLYKQATVPLCQKCNGESLSSLEKRIQSKTATMIDYFVWAVKIRFLLAYKDTTLQLDRADKEKGPLMSEDEALVGKEFVKHLLGNFDRPGFTIIPNPFGTVFLIENPIKDNNFGLVDVPNPYWGLCITLPGDIILAVLITDRCMVQKELENDYKQKGGFTKYCKSLPATNSLELTRQILLKLVLKQYQIENIPYDVSLWNEGIKSAEVPLTAKYRSKLKEIVLIHIVQSLKYPSTLGKQLYADLPKIYQG